MQNVEIIKKEVHTFEGHKFILETIKEQAAHGGRLISYTDGKTTPNQGSG